MQAHHTLMVKTDKDGEIVDHKAIPNNEWAKWRRTGWEFASAEMVKEYESMMAERASSAEQDKQARQREDAENEKGDGPVVTKDDKKPSKKLRLPTGP